MELDEKLMTFLSQNRTAAMISLRRDGTPHVARVAIALVDGKVWSSGNQSRLRTRFLHRDPRCTLFVFEEAGQRTRWAGLETEVTILDGQDAPELNLKLFRVMQQGMTVSRPGNLLWFGQERTESEFLDIMKTDQRLIYEFEVKRAYGLY